MFEWGYALAELPPRLIFAAVVGFDRARAPTDLQGMWLETFEGYRRYQGGVENVSKKKLRECAEKIGQRFSEKMLESSVIFPEDPFYWFSEWASIKDRLSSLNREQTPLSPKEKRNIATHIVIPYIYSNAEPSLETFFDGVLYHDEEYDEIVVAKNVYAYFCARSNAEGLTVGLSSYDKFFEIKKNLSAVLKRRNKNDWIDLIASNFSSLVSRKIALVHNNNIGWRKQMEKAEEEINAAERILLEIEKKNKCSANSIFLWKGFIYYNKYNILSAKSKSRKLINLVEDAASYRGKAFSALSAESSKEMHAKFLWEKLLAEIEVYNAKEICGGLSVDRTEVNLALSTAISFIKKHVSDGSKNISDIVEKIENNKLYLSDKESKRAFEAIKIVLDK